MIKKIIGLVLMLPFLTVILYICYPLEESGLTVNKAIACSFATAILMKLFCVGVYLL